MFGSQKKNIIFILYQDSRTVFRLIDVAMLVGETDLQVLGKKLNYYVHKGQMHNPRKGIYTKPEFNIEELACRLYSPSYISLDYVMQKNGIVFQFDSQITLVSYLSRVTEIENHNYRFRKIKGAILTNATGIIRQNNHVNQASPERAFLDMLYLDPNRHVDNLNPLDKSLLKKILPIYESKSLTQRFNTIFKNV